MKFDKITFCAAVLITAASALFAQEQQVQKKNDSAKRGETSVENEYLSDGAGPRRSRGAGRRSRASWCPQPNRTLPRRTCAPASC